MKDNLSLKQKDQLVVSSGFVLRAMQPTLKTLLSVRVINDNGNAQSDAIKQMWAVAAGVAIAVGLVLLG